MHHCTNLVVEDIRQLYETHGFYDSIFSLHHWSDNCASQFKCANTFGWAYNYLLKMNLVCLVNILRIRNKSLQLQLRQQPFSP